MGFAAGFFGRLADNMKDRREYVREMSQRKRDYLMEEGLKRQGEIRQVRDGLEESTRILREAGMEESRVASLLRYDPSAVMSTAKLVRDRRATANPISAGALNQIIDAAETTDMSLSDIIREVTPMFNRTEFMAPEEQERNIFATIFGVGDTGEIDRNVYGKEILGGYTGADIMSSLNAPLYTRSEEVGGVDYTGLASREIDTREAIVIRNDMIDKYNNLLDNRIAELRGSPKPEDVAELNRLRRLKDLDDYTRVATLIKDKSTNAEGVRYFGPKIANFFYQDHGEVVLPVSYFGEDILDIVKNFEDTSPEATPEGTPAGGGGTPEGEKPPLPEPPEGTTPVTKDGATIYFDAEGNPVYAVNPDGIPLIEPIEVQKLADSLGISKPEPTFRRGSSRVSGGEFPEVTIPQPRAGSTISRREGR